MAVCGIMNTGGNLGGIIGIPIVGYFSGLHAWNTAFFIGVGFALVSAAAWLGIRVEQAAAPAVPPVPGGAVVGEGAILR
jgi:MFS family permease